MDIKIEVSDDARLIMFAAQNVVERELVKYPDLKADGSRLWLKNGYGIDLIRTNEGPVTLTVIRRELNRLFRIEPGTPATPGGTADIRNVDTAEIVRVLTVLKSLPLFMHRDFRINTMGRIMIHADKTGNYFFDGNNARHTQQTRARTAYNSFGPAGAFFVTGEIIKAGERRKYTVRRAWFTLKFDAVSREWMPYLEITNASGFQEYNTPAIALTRANDLAQAHRNTYAFLPDPQAQSPFGVRMGVQPVK